MPIPWKEFERKVAKLLGTTRVYRGGDFSKSLPDILHDTFQPECKYRSTLPKFLNHLLPHTILSICPMENQKPCLFALKVSSQVFNTPSLLLGVSDGIGCIVAKKGLSFIEQAMEQAESYGKDKIPVVFLRGRNTRYFYIFTRTRDAMRQLIDTITLYNPLKEAIDLEEKEESKENCCPVCEGEVEEQHCKSRCKQCGSILSTCED